MKISTTLLALTLATSVIACGKAPKKPTFKKEAPKAEVANVEAVKETEEKAPEVKAEAVAEAPAAEAVKTEEAAKPAENPIVVREISPEDVALPAVTPEEEKELAETPEAESPKQNEILVIKGTCEAEEDGEGSLAMVQQKQQVAQATFADNDCKVPTEETAQQAAR